MLRREFLSLAALAGACGIMGSDPAFAQAAFPEQGKPITIIVPYAAGGGTDISARLLATGLEQIFSTPVVVVNRPGASGRIGLSQLAQSANDGYTIGYCVLETLITHYVDPAQQDIPYRRDNFETVAMHQLLPSLFAVRTESPIEDLDGMIEAARANPGRLTVSTSGLFSVSHVAAILFEKEAEISFAAAHYNGGAPSTAALLGGEVEVQAGTIVDSLTHMEAGAVRVLSVNSAERSPFMPDVPTLKELGYEVEADAHTGLLAPAGTPSDVIEILSAAIQEVITSPEHRDRLASMGLAERYLDPAEFDGLWDEKENVLTGVFESISGE